LGGFTTLSSILIWGGEKMRVSEEAREYIKRKGGSIYLKLTEIKNC